MDSLRSADLVTASAPADPPLDVSVVVPVYDEAESLPELAAQLEAALERTGGSFELICVDDGSRDGSAAACSSQAGRRAALAQAALPHPQLRPVGRAAGRLRRRARRDVVTLDADLQNDPADIPALLKMLDEGRIDVVSRLAQGAAGRRSSRKLPSWSPTASISRVTGVELHDYGCALKVYRARGASNGLRLYGELHRFIPALAARGRREDRRECRCATMRAARRVEVRPRPHRSACCSTCCGSSS